MFEVTKACGAFMKLLEEQLDRVAGMKDEKTDFTTKKCVTIDDANDDLFFGGEVGFLLIHTCNPVHLLFQQFHKGTAGLGYFKHYSPPSLV